MARNLRVLVCGGRDYNDREAVFQALDRVHARRVIALVVQGDARGADRLAGEWARARGIPCAVCPADWDKYGKRAGYVRNQHMLDEYSPHVVIAFPGGRGTDNMKLIARRADVPVWEPVAVETARS